MAEGDEEVVGTEPEVLEYLTGPPPEPQPRQPFASPKILETPGMWGPAGPFDEKFRDIPYQPFSKSDRLGKAADITGTAFQSRGNRYQSMFGAGDAYAFFNEEDESSFNIVHSKKKADLYQKRKWQERTSRKDLYRARDDRRMAGMGTQPPSKAQKNRERDRARMERRWQRKFSHRKQQNRGGGQIEREPSVDPKSSWKILEELEMSKLNKLSTEVGAPEDLLKCGTLRFYDKQNDRVSVKQNKRMPTSTDKAFHNVTTTDDPNIREIAKGDKANVFATDTVLSAIMCCSRSVYPWDVVIQKVGDKIFIDKRDNSEFDYLTVDETAFDPPSSDGNPVDSPERLALEATFVNRLISETVTKSKDPYKFENAENPFLEEDEVSCSVGYRYRMWNLGNDINLVARTQHDAVFKDKQGRTGFMDIKALNEYEVDGVADWRQRLDKQRGAILATALKNNQNKIARWTLNSMMSGTMELRLAFVSRASRYDAAHHVLLGMQSFKPKDLATQINLNIQNGWAILKRVIELVKKHGEGKFVLMRDPNKQTMRLYSVPPSTFEESDEESSDEDDDDDKIGVRVRDDDIPLILS